MRMLKLCLLGAAWLAAAPYTYAAAVITYLSGPNFCSTGPGYTNSPYCVIPGEFPLGGFPVPAAGGTYIDPNFGGLVRILTGTPLVHIYSQPTPMSAHNKYFGIRNKDNGFAYILDFTTGQTVLDKTAFDDAWVWDAVDDDIHYRMHGAAIYKMSVSTGVETLLVDYSQTPQHFSWLQAGGSTDTSKDNWLSFWAPAEHQVCAVDLINVRTYCADYLSAESTAHIGLDWIDYSMISKGVDSTNGKRYVLLMAGPAMGMWSVNMAAGRLDFEARGGDNYEWGSNRDGYCDPNEFCLQAPHADVMEDANGKQYLVAMKGVEAPCSLQLVTMDLSKGRFMFWPEQFGGGMHYVMNMANCGEPWPDYDLGCSKQTSYCVVTTYRNSNRDPADVSTPFPTEPHRDQIAIMRGNGDEVRFLATTRTVTFSNDNYYSQPRSAISPDGQYVIFDSNFGISNAERVAALSTSIPLNVVKSVSVTPASASGATQTLTATFTDAAATTDLTSTSVWIKAAGGSFVNSCLIRYDRASNTVQLADDSGAVWSSSTLQNSQCSVSGASFASLGNAFTMTLPVTLKPAFNGVKEVWLNAIGNAGASGWTKLGGWTLASSGTVSNTSVTPSAGSGPSQVFTAVWTDTAGATDLASATLLLAQSAVSAASNGCSVTWTRSTGAFQLADATQCSLDASGARAVDSGNTVTLSVPLAFKPAFSGAKGIWMNAISQGSSTGVQQMGTWTVPGSVVTNVSITPNTGSGMSQVFSAVFSDNFGASDISTASVSIFASGGASGSCSVSWTRSTGLFQVADTTQCSLAANASAADSGNTLTLTLPLTFNASFAGAKTVWISAKGSGLAPNALEQRGSWTVPAPVVTNTSLTPNAGSGSSTVFAAVFGDTAGSTDIASATLSLGPTGLSIASGTCVITWTRSTAQFVAGDPTQCTVDAASARSADNGSSLTLTIPVRFTSAFTGTKAVSVTAAGSGGAASPMQQLGTWTVTGAAVTNTSITPNAGTGSSATFSAVFTDTLGAADISSATVSFVVIAGSPGCGITWSRTANAFQVTDTSVCSLDATARATDSGNTVTLTLPVTFKPSFSGAKTIFMNATGSSASASAPQAMGSWTVPAPVLTNASITPGSGTGSSVTFTAAFSDTAGASDIASATVSLTSGSPARCAITWSRTANAFAVSDASMCTVDASARASDSGNTVTLTLPVTFTGAFTGTKTIYMSATGSGASATGLQPMGSWTVPAPTVTNSSVTPNAGSGLSAIFNAVFTDTAGASDLASATVTFTQFSYVAITPCTVTWTRSPNQFQVADTSVCTLDASSARATDAGNTVTLALPVTFKATFSGAKQIWLSATGSAAGSSTAQQMGSWTVPPPAISNTSVTPGSGSGMSTTFNAVFTNPAGASDLSSATVLIAATAGSTGCSVTWSRPLNLFQVSDSSICSLGAARATDSGNTVTLSLPVTFKPGFSGAKSIYLSAGGFVATASPVQAMGSWSVPSGAVTNTSITPNAGTGATATFTAVFTDAAGATDVSSATVSFAATGASSSCAVTWSRSLNAFQVADASVCSLDVAARETDSGNIVTLALPITFKPNFSGAKTIYMSATGSAATASTAQPMGSWTIPPPAIANTSIAPGTGSGTAATFAAVFTDLAGASDIAAARVLIASTATSPGCSVTWTRATGQFAVNDTTLCALDPTARATDSGNTVTLTLPVTFKPLFSGAKSTFLSATGASATASALQQMGSWTIPASTITNTSITPAAGSGTAATFTAVFTDPAGAGDIATGTVLIAATATSPGCSVTWTRVTGQFAINDTTLCTLDPTARATDSGNTVTLTLPVTFKPVFSGAKSAFLSAAGVAAAASALQPLGTWTIPAPALTNTSITPNAGSGVSATFTAVFTDAAGAGDIASGTVLVAPAGTSFGCSMKWMRATGQFAVNDSSVCALGAGTRAVDSGNTVTLTLPVTFNAAFAGAKAIYLSASGTMATASAVQQMGSWTVPAPAVVVGNTSLTPSSGSDLAPVFTAVFTDTAGAADLSSATLWITSSTAAQSGACYITWDRATNQFRLLSDIGTPTTAMQNSQCVVDRFGVRAVSSGSTLTLTVPVTFKSPFGGAKTIWMSATGGTASSALQQMGSWTVPATAAANVSVTPNAGSGSTGVFVATWSDTAGAADLSTLYFRLTNGGNTTVGSCNVVYTASTRQFALQDDSGNTLSGNSPLCGLDINGSRASVSGNTAILTIVTNYKATFIGTKEIWMSATGTQASAAPQRMGTWTVPPRRLSALAAAPESGQALSQTFTISWSDSVGASDVLSTWFWFTPDFGASAAASCLGYYDRPANQIKLLNDAGTDWLSATRGSSVRLQNSQCSIDAGSAIMMANGGILMLLLPVSFNATFAGPKELWTLASGFEGNTEWTRVAAWTVPGN